MCNHRKLVLINRSRSQNQIHHYHWISYTTVKLKSDQSEAASGKFSLTCNLQLLTKCSCRDLLALWFLFQHMHHQPSGAAAQEWEKKSLPNCCPTTVVWIIKKPMHANSAIITSSELCISFHAYHRIIREIEGSKDTSNTEITRLRGCSPISVEFRRRSLLRL